MSSSPVREYRISNVECRTAEVLRNSLFVIRYSAVNKAAGYFFTWKFSRFYRLRSGPFEGPATAKPPALPEDTYYPEMAATPWDIHPNGKKFLMIKPAASAGAATTAASPQPKITIVVNWFEELKQRVPVK
jgi:hypothetical protein